jgi:hypothetical protein
MSRPPGVGPRGLVVRRDDLGGEGYCTVWTMTSPSDEDVLVGADVDVAE